MERTSRGNRLLLRTRVARTGHPYDLLRRRPGRRGRSCRAGPSRAKFREAQETHPSGLEKELFSRLTDDEVRQLATITCKILEDQ